MRRLVTGRQMKEIDGYAIGTVGIPSLVLMERAALAAADRLSARFQPESGTRVLIFCGTGNNGADGAALARILFLRGFDVTVLTVGDRERWTEEMVRQTAIDGRLGILVESFGAFLPGRFDVAVDALFGVGLSRDVEGVFAQAIHFMEEQRPAFTLALDIPSGVSAETGEILGTAVRADETVTFGCEKLGMLFYPGRELCGRVTVADIGFPPPESISGPRYFAGEAADLERIPPRRPEANKGTYGKVLIAAGSPGMCGAAYLSALAAYRTGAGLVRILTAPENVPVLQARLPEAIITPCPADPETADPEALEQLVERACAWASVIVLGPGLGRDDWAERLVRQVLLSAYVPIIVDADGLNAVAACPQLAGYFTENVIVTPHLGEMARLTGREIADLKRSLPQAAMQYAEEKGVICVLKDAVSVVARRDGSVFVGDSGCPAMAKGGSGDVLTGILAGLIALGIPEEDAACLGVYLHGLAGTAAAAGRGEHSILAGEIADCISAVMQRNKPAAGGRDQDKETAGGKGTHVGTV